jgi:hypothetical protein
MNVQEVDKRAAALVQLAREELTGDSALSDDAGFARLEARRAAVAAPRWSRRVVLGGATVAAGAALSLTLYVQTRSRALTFDVAGGSLSKSGHVIAREGTRIAFSDGSEARLSRGTEARIQNVTEHGAEVVLSRGSMYVHIAKKPRASWNVAAGPYDVRVTGTSFDVSWSGQSQAFDLRMVTGSVMVSGPLAQGGIPLRAGQHMFVAEGRLTVEGGDAKPSTAPSAVVAESSGQAPAVQDVTADAIVPSDLPSELPAAPLPSNVVGRAASDAQTWRRQVAEGHFDAVLEQAERRGLERTLTSGSLDELGALADAARYAGRNPIARRALLAERQRFAGSTAARDAAFFLGRIEEDSGGGGLDWYERYLSESPRGAYVSQAYGRKMMLIYKQRGAGAAKAAATDYLSRYPNGPYAAAARKLMQEPPTARVP